MSEPRQIAVVREYSELVDALRARALELNVSRSEIDAVSGLQSGYAAKLLAPVPIRNIGPMSFGPLLQALGLSLIVVEDQGSKERFVDRMPNRRHRMPSFGEHDIIEYRKTRRALRKAGRLGAKKRNENLSEKRRQKLARNAARSRWRRIRETQRRAKAAARDAKASQAAALEPCANQSPLPNG